VSGIVDLGECHVTQSSTLAAAALEAEVPAIVLSPSACTFWLSCGAQALGSHIRIETSSKTDTPVPLVEVVPEFGEILTDEARETALVRFVIGLALRVAGKPVMKPCILEGGELWLDREQFDGLPWRVQVELLIGKALNAKWFSGDAAAAVPVGNLRPEILVMQPAQNWHRQRATDGLDSTWDWRVLVQR
jgi:hypothetical protein